jgi:poly(A) polymerase
MTGEPTPSHEQERRVAEGVVRRLRGAGHEAYFVGGCVREMLLGHEPADHDVTTDATPDRVAEIFPHVVEVGRRFGVMTVIDEGVHVEVATYRTEESYSDGRRPDSVRFATAREDISRRDFTVNALLHDPVSGEVVDHVGGLADLKARVLRTVGDPRERFAEDHLRILRAVRFTARLGFTLEASTRDACRELAATVVRVSPERVRDELGRMLLHATRAEAFRLLDDLGVMRHVLPEISALHGVRQPAQYHPEGDVFIHVMLALEKLPPGPSEAAAWGTLLHDIGKPATFTEAADRIRFHGHEVVGARMAEELADRLRFSNALRDRVSVLVRKHLVHRDAPNMRASTLRAFLAEPWLDDLLVVMRADVLAGSGVTTGIDFLERAREEIGTQLPPPLLTGRDLIAAGIAPGPEIGRILHALRTEQLDGRLATLDEAMVRARAIAAGEA